MKKLLLLAGLFLLMALAAGLALLQPPDPSARMVVFIIPEGAAARESRGFPAANLPKAITLTLGAMDTLSIRNEDGFVARVGPFKLEPGQSFTQQYDRPGTYELICTTIYHVENMQITVIENPDPLKRFLAGLQK